MQTHVAIGDSPRTLDLVQPTSKGDEGELVELYYALFTLYAHPMYCKTVCVSLLA